MNSNFIDKNHTKFLYSPISLVLFYLFCCYFFLFPQIKSDIFYPLSNYKNLIFYSNS